MLESQLSRHFSQQLSAHRTSTGNNLRNTSSNFASLKSLSFFVKMKLQYVCLIFGIILCSIAMCEAFPFRAGNIDYMEAIRRMQQIPQWHCMRYRKFQLHGHCSRWLLMRRT